LTRPRSSQKQPHSGTPQGALRSSKLLLIADQRPGSEQPTQISVRRFRLARLRLEGRALESALRFVHRKRVYD
jgi:hypothetical protein